MIILDVTVNKQKLYHFNNWNTGSCVWTEWFLVAFYWTSLPDVFNMFTESWVKWEGESLQRSDLKTEFPQTMCLSCDAKIVLLNKSLITNHSSEIDYWSFVNQMFDCVRLAKFHSKFDYVWLSSVMERAVFQWVRLPTCSIRYCGM